MNYIKIPILLLVSSFFLIGCDSTSNNSTPPSSHSVQQLSEAEIKENLRQKECSNWRNNIVVKGTASPKTKGLRRRVVGLDLTLFIKNHSEVATYKDLKMKVYLQSKTGTRFKTQEMTIYEFLQPEKIKTIQRHWDISEQEYKDYDKWGIEYLDCHCTD